MSTEQELRNLKQRYSAQLLRLPGVCGVGIEKDDSGKLALTVHLNAIDPNAGEGVPAILEGHKVKRVRSGPFKRF